MKKDIIEDWDGLSDTPQEYDEAIRTAVSKNERTFFTKLRFKVLHETAASNDVLMHEHDNEDSLFILRVGSDDIMIGRNLLNPEETTTPEEYGGIFLALQQDLYPYLNRHVTLQEWLRERDYKGIRYDANNDYK